MRGRQDFFAGTIYAAFGLAAILIGRDYEMGTATRMGPAYFPSVLGGLLLLIGVISIARSRLDSSCYWHATARLAAGFDWHRR